MSKSSSDGASQFRVGPDTDPDRYVLGTAFSSGAEGILYRGTITTGAGMTLDVAIKMLQPRFLSRVDEWHKRWAEQVELLRSLVTRAIAEYVDGKNIVMLASMAKLKCGRLSREIADSCLQYFGGMGYMNETPITRYWRDSRLGSIGGGADEIMLGIISKEMKTLPERPRSRSNGNKAGAAEAN